MLLLGNNCDIQPKIKEKHILKNKVYWIEILLKQA